MNLFTNYYAIAKEANVLYMAVLLGSYGENFKSTKEVLVISLFLNAEKCRAKGR